MKPFEHQARITKEAVKNLCEYGYHAIFAEVGTGKSKMLIDTAKECADKNGVKGLLISGPKSLAGTWKEQVALHCDIPGYAFATFDCSTAKTKKWQAAFEIVMQVPFPILFVNTEAFQTMPKVLMDVLSGFANRRNFILVRSVPYLE